MTKGYWILLGVCFAAPSMAVPHASVEGKVAEWTIGKDLKSVSSDLKASSAKWVKQAGLVKNVRVHTHEETLETQGVQSLTSLLVDFVPDQILPSSLFQIESKLTTCQDASCHSKLYIKAFGSDVIGGVGNLVFGNDLVALHESVSVEVELTPVNQETKVRLTVNFKNDGFQAVCRKLFQQGYISLIPSRDQLVEVLKIWFQRFLQPVTT